MNTRVGPRADPSSSHRATHGVAMGSCPDLTPAPRLYQVGVAYVTYWLRLPHLSKGAAICGWSSYCSFQLGPAPLVAMYSNYGLCVRSCFLVAMCGQLLCLKYVTG